MDYLPCNQCLKACDLDSEAFYPYSVTNEEEEYLYPDFVDDVYCESCACIITNVLDKIN
jgi:hypothetical protein